MSTKNIVFIGMPGCGKSSIGLMISSILQTDFYDLDQYIEEQAQTSISQLFKLGEDYFRQLENIAVREIHHKQAVVISTGGGIVTNPDNMILLRQTGIIFYIDRPIPMILESSDFTNRPLLATDCNKIYTLHEQRKHLYVKYCDFRIINDQSLEIAVDQITKIIREHGEKHRHIT